MIARPTTLYVPTIGPPPHPLEYIGREYHGGIIVDAEWQSTEYRDGDGHGTYMMWQLGGGRFRFTIHYPDSDAT